MFKITKIIALSICLSFSGGVAVANGTMAGVMKQIAGTYVSSSTTADLEESVIWVLSADGTCFATYTTLNLDPVDAHFTPGIGEASCGWEIIKKDNNAIMVRAFFLEYARDPDNVVFQNDECKPACLLYGVTVGPIQDGVWIQEETASFLNLNLQPISSGIFGPYLERPYGINTLLKFDINDALNNLQNVGAPLPDGLP